MRIAIALCWLVSAAAPALAADSVSLFNGRDLTGWKYVDQKEGGSAPAADGKLAGFVVREGVLESVPVAGAGGILLYTGQKLGNGRLHVEYSMSDASGNSGVFIRVPSTELTWLEMINKGIEVQIDENDDDFHRTGCLYSWTKALSKPAKPAPQWNTMDIELIGPRTVVKVNGELVTDYDGVSPLPPKTKWYEPERGPRPNAGFIGLQNHDGKAVIRFRKVEFQATKL